MAPPAGLDPAAVVAVLSSMYVSPTILLQNLNIDTLAVAPPTTLASRRWVICPTTLRDDRSLTLQCSIPGLRPLAHVRTGGRLVLEA